MTQETELILSIAGFPPYSGRGCFQQLMPADKGFFQRTINGALSCISLETPLKYRSLIRGKDVSSPAFDRFWVNTQVTVGCIHRLWQRFKKGEAHLTLTRPPVEGSVCVVDCAGQPVPFVQRDQDIRLQNPSSNETFVSFRPWLTMIVSDFRFETDEWGIANAWQLILEEM